MSDFSKKLLAGGLPTDQDWERHLIEVHARDPRMTPEAFAGFRTDEGLSSYEVLAAELKSESKDVLDLACGDGHLIPHLLPRLDAAAGVVGLDMSPEGLELARAQVRDPRVNFALARAQAMPLEDDSIDHILCHMAFMLMSPVEPVVAEIRRVLRPRGRFSVVISGGEPAGLYREIRRLIGIFVQFHLPRYQEARGSRAQVGTPEGVQALFGAEFTVAVRDFQLRYHVEPEGLWNYARNMYFVPMMPEHAQRELKGDLLALARDHSDNSGKIAFYVPMKLISAAQA